MTPPASSDHHGSTPHPDGRRFEKPPSALQMVAGDGHRDASLVLDGLRSACEQLFAALDRKSVKASATEWPSHLRQLLLVLELRWKLEEQVLYPALFATYRCDRRVFDHEESDIVQLRDLAQALREEAARISDDSLHHQRLQLRLLRQLEGAATLHFDDVEHLLDRSRSEVSLLQREHLGREMQALLARWRQDLLDTGDIEDEDQDPVGLPPR